MAAARCTGRNDLVITTIDLGIKVALEMAQDWLIKGLGTQLPYQQGVTKVILAGYSLLGKQAPHYVAVFALKVTKGNLMDVGNWFIYSKCSRKSQNGEKAGIGKEKPF